MMAVQRQPRCLHCARCCLDPSCLARTGGITRVSEALEVIDKSAALGDATAAALASAGGGEGGEADTIRFT